MFTDRFIKVPIKTIDKELADFATNEQWEDNWEKINPLEISSYRPSEDKTSHIITAIFMKNGDNIMGYLTPQEFEKALNDHQK